MPSGSSAGLRAAVLRLPTSQTFVTFRLPAELAARGELWHAAVLERWMTLTVLPGPAHVPLAEAICARLRCALTRRLVERFPDGELHVEIQESVRGHDVFLIQPTGPPVNDHLIELLLLADACRRAGAARLTAVVPYFGYARQDRRAGGREPIAARLVADLIRTAGLERIVAVDLHSPAVEGFFGMPIEHLTAVPLLAEALRTHLPEHAVLVAPDLGAVKLVQRYADLLHRPVVIARKVRVSGAEAHVGGLVGEVRGRVPVIVDDMISTAGTIEAAAQALVAEGAERHISVAATHLVLAPRAVERLQRIPLQQLVSSDSLPSPGNLPFSYEAVSLAGLLAEAIMRLHSNRSLGDLLVHV
jgi:ribose-phosphate pyrophosphokinase